MCDALIMVHGLVYDKKLNKGLVALNQTSYQWIIKMV